MNTAATLNLPPPDPGPELPHRRQPPEINHRDRLSITLFLAIAFHALVLLGVGFEFMDRTRQDPVNTLDVTLVQTESEEEPEQADYLAQADQKGQGNTRERVRPTRPKSNPGQRASPGPSQATQTPTNPEPPKPDKPQVVTTPQPAPTRASEQPPQPEAEPRRQASAAQLIHLSRQEARLEARIDANRRAYSQRPDPKFLAASTRKFEDAAYLAEWTRRVEHIGNLNYPEAARRQGVSGSLLMEVALAPDGSLIEVRLLRSSGHPVLDKAAARIVRLAAPYAEVPDNVLDGHNELRITRSWVFTSRNELVSK